jgi:chorismate synthase
MQAVKGVEIGLAEQGAASFGSKVQDTIHYQRDEHRFTRGAKLARRTPAAGEYTAPR